MVTSLLIVILSLGAMTYGQLRDAESGVLNLYEVSLISSKICEQETKIRQMINNPLLLGFGATILNTQIPLLPGPDNFTPLHLVEIIFSSLNKIEDHLMALLEGKHMTTVKPPKEHKNHTHIEIGDLLAIADFICKTIHTWYDIVTTKVSDLLGLWHLRFPIPDPQHSFKLIHALDIFDLLGIPDRIHRLLTGHLGLTTTTTTTTTRKPGGGFFGSFFNRDTTIGPISTTVLPQTTKHQGGFFGGLFGKKGTSIAEPSKEQEMMTVEDVSTEKPKGPSFFGSRGKSKSTSTTTQTVQQLSPSEDLMNNNDEMPQNTSEEPEADGQQSPQASQQSISTSNEGPEDDTTLTFDDQEMVTSESPIETSTVDNNQNPSSSPIPVEEPTDSTGNSEETTVPVLPPPDEHIQHDDSSDY